MSETTTEQGDKLLDALRDVQLIQNTPDDARAAWAEIKHAVTVYDAEVGARLAAAKKTKARACKHLREQLHEIGEAFGWLWGFWDGNTLIAARSEYFDDIQEAFTRLANAIGPREDEP